MKLRHLIRVVVYGALIAGIGVVVYDVSALADWDGSGQATVIVEAPQPVRRVCQLKWGFRSAEVAGESISDRQPTAVFEGMVRNMKAVEGGFALEYKTSGRKSRLGFWSDTFTYSPWWVVFVELADGSVWAAVVPLPDNLRKEPAPTVPLSIPNGANPIETRLFPFPFPEPAPAPS